jgi:hypothetical protein
MKEIRQNLSRHGFDLILKQSRRQGIGFYSQKNIEIKSSFINSMHVDYHDVWFD